MKNEFKHKLGDELKCKITGFKGVIVSRMEWMTGCNRYGLQDEDLIEPTKKKQVLKKFEENTGGSKPNPSKY